YRKQVVVDNRRCFLEIYHGLVDYRNRGKTFCTQSQARILVYLIASRVTFDRVESFWEAVKRLKECGQIFMLVGNQWDRSYEREVFKKEDAALARQLECEFFQTSSGTSQNVE
ncbi:small GTPase superfamily, partial [Mycena galopus ATCC 62051]